MCNVFTVFKLHSIDATEEDGRMGRLINHSRQAPNKIPKQLKLSGTVVHVYFQSIRDISNDACEKRYGIYGNLIIIDRYCTVQVS